MRRGFGVFAFCGVALVVAHPLPGVVLSPDTAYTTTDAFCLPWQRADAVDDGALALKRILLSVVVNGLMRWYWLILSASVLLVLVEGRRASAREKAVLFFRNVALIFCLLIFVYDVHLVVARDPAVRSRMRSAALDTVAVGDRPDEVATLLFAPCGGDSSVHGPAVASVRRDTEDGVTRCRIFCTASNCGNHVPTRTPAASRSLRREDDPVTCPMHGTGDAAGTRPSYFRHRYL